MKNAEIRSSVPMINLCGVRTLAMTSLISVICLLALSPGALVAQIAAEESSPSAEETPSEFPGTYIFEWPEGRSVAEIYVDGSALTATLEISGGYILQLVGAAQGKNAYGKIAGQSGTGDYGDFEATIEGDELQLTLSPRSENGEADEPLHIIFSRAAVADAPEETTADRPAETEETSAPEQLSNPAPEGAGGDDRLIGTWVYQTLITSGSDSFASEQFLIFRADGSYSYGDGSTVAGGSGWSYDGGDEGETERGYWRAQDGILYLRDANGEWNRIGKFGMTEDGTTMRITYDSGGKKLWSRR